ncbi:hypothetical protein ACE38W_01400 [Chitinophaga sp. Hz27]|uniref:hypothetical protein n=1 Tax=Chitinophaga sp. Hz27 TaxID=3347169 RepID=UPI0035D60A46
MKKMRQTILLLAIIFLPIYSFAHGYWLEINGNGQPGKQVIIQIFFGEIDQYGKRLKETYDTLPAADMFRIIAVHPDGKMDTLKVSARKDGWQATFTPILKGSYRILATGVKLPVVDRSGSGGQNIRPFEYLCSSYQTGLGMTNNKPLQMLDIISQQQKDMMQVTVFKDGKPCATGAKLRIFNPDNWEKQLETDSTGSAEFYPNRKGLYIIRYDWYDKTPGTYEGVSYSAVRHRCDYCLLVQ